MHIFMPARTQTTESQHKNMCSHTSPHQGSICTRFGSMVAIWARVAVYGRDNGTRFAWSGKSHLLRETFKRVTGCEKDSGLAAYLFQILTSI